VLGDARLRDAELLLNDRADVAGRQLTVGEQFEDPATDRIAEYGKSVHYTMIQDSVI